MKRLFVMSIASIILLTGCGATETLSCTYKTNANNGTTEINYDIDHQEDEIKKVRITYNYDFNDTNNNNGTNTRIAGVDVTGTVDTNGTNGNGNTNGTTRNDNTNMNGNIDDANISGTTGNGNAGNNATANNDNNMTGNNGITGYNSDVNQDNTATNDDNNQIDGVGTGTDGTTNDSQIDKDGIVDGIVGSAIDTIVGGVTSIILDAAGLRDRHATVQNTYGNVNGFSVQNTNDANNNYSVTYVIDYDTISDDDLNSFNLSRDLDEMRDNYVNQGFTCE